MRTEEQIIKRMKYIENLIFSTDELDVEYCVLEWVLHNET